jgi:hypothetical protein
MTFMGSSPVPKRTDLARRRFRAQGRAMARLDQWRSAEKCARSRFYGRMALAFAVAAVFSWMLW